MSFKFTKRRLFISSDKGCFQLFSFTQAKTDASIYVSSPDFAKVKWLNIFFKDGNPQLRVTDAPGDGKLSVHGSGMVKISPNERALVIHGNYLLDSKKQALGVRHLFTVQLAEPKFLPVSPALNRSSDYVINTKHFAPIAILFFAIPKVCNLTVNFKVSFDIDDLESIPPESGMGSLELLFHNVVWFAYRTKHMDEWPQNPHICYHDGYLVPVLIGTGNKQFRAEFRSPTYELSKTELAVEL